MEQTMLTYYREQPKILAEILINRSANTQAFAQAWQAQKPDRLYLIASGTSYNAASVAVPFFEELLGVETTVCTPTSLPKIRGESPLLVFISQGGNSNNTLAAIEACREHAKLVLVGSSESRMAQLHPFVLIACGPETAGPKTKGYTGTVLTLQLMALDAAQATGKISAVIAAEYLSTLEQAVANMTENIHRCEAWLEDNTAELVRIEKICITANGNGQSVAAESALKLLETMLVPAAAFEFEEYLHGPICALEEAMAGLYFLPPQKGAALNRMLKLVQFHRTLSPLVYTVGGGPVPGAHDKRDCCVLTTGKWFTVAYEWVLVSQLMGACLPVPMGIAGRGHKVYVALSEALQVKFGGGA